MTDWSKPPEMTEAERRHAFADDHLASAVTRARDALWTRVRPVLEALDEIEFALEEDPDDPEWSEAVRELRRALNALKEDPPHD